MPNPFTRAGGAANTGYSPPQRIQPVPEEYAGDNNTWRGIESHGVAPTVESAMPPGWAEGVAVEYLPHEYEQEPVPVRIVDQFKKQRRRHRADRVTIRKQNPTMLIGADDQRTNLIIRNDNDFVSVMIGSSDGVRDYIGGYTLEGNQSITLTTQDAVWVYYPDATPDTLNVSILAEFTVEVAE